MNSAREVPELTFVLSTNISANSVSAGCDLTALLPRFIVRYLCHRNRTYGMMLEHSTRRVHRCHRRSEHVPMESFEE